MFRKLSPFGSLLLLAGAAVFATPDFALAQRGGGGHMGGAHFSGGHIGGARLGGYHGGFSSAGTHNGFAHNYYPTYGSYHHDNHDGFHHNYPYNGYGYYPYNYYTSPYTWSAPAYDPGYYGGLGYEAQSYPDAYTPGTEPSGSYQSYYPPATGTAQPAAAQLEKKARVTVNAPANAEIWFNGTKMTSTGSVRNYESPPLAPGVPYTYAVEARWNENGQEMTQTQQIAVTADSHVSVSFPASSKTAGQVSAVK